MASPLRWWVAAALCVGMGTASPLLAQRVAAPPAITAPTNDDCLGCHSDPDLKSEKGRPVGFDVNKFVVSSHGALGLACVDCHTDLAKTTEFPHASPLAKAQCTACHEDAVKLYESSIHAAARRQDAASVAATCSDCHTTHETRSSKDPASTTYALNLPATCARCHGDPAIIAKGHIAIGNVADLYKDSIHGKAVSKSGLLVAANCTSCHGSHDIRPHTDPASRVSKAAIPATCGSCHEGIQTQFARGVHGAALASGKANAPVCADCHTAHQIQRADVASWRLDVIRECGTCHEDKIKTYRDTFHGQVTSLGFVRVATCATCHGAHEIHGKDDGRSMVSRERVLETCRQCHQNATEKFALYDPHADKHDRERNPVLYYTSIFMTVLLAGVFTAFGLHTLLWLPRSFIARRQKRP